MTTERVIPEWLLKQEAETGVYWGGKYEPDLTVYPTWQDCFAKEHGAPSYFVAILVKKLLQNPTEADANRVKQTLSNMFHGREWSDKTNADRDYWMWHGAVLDETDPADSRIRSFQCAYDVGYMLAMFSTAFNTHRELDRRLTDIVHRRFPEMKGWF